MHTTYAAYLISLDSDGRVGHHVGLAELGVVVVEEDGAGGRLAADGVEGVEVLVQHEQVHHVLGRGARHALREVHNTVPVFIRNIRSKDGV